MFGIGGGELIFIIFIALMLFGTDKLPEAARTFGKVMANLKHATNEIKTEIQKGVDANGLDISMNQITSTFTEEVDKVKESVTANVPDLGTNVLNDATASATKIKEDFENITGPIKRQM
ncbi:MAG: twin-arginine translocase TatA/TatE family subunit [Flavobacteriaceae bacterium]|nr:twin-arginine translocase TatA/TatE family subunit [Flavobacteriaceae bacterium]